MNYVQTMQSVRSGKLAALADAKMEELVTAVKDHNKSGTITVKLTLKPDGDGLVRVSSDVSTSLPQKKLKDSLMYMADDGRLSRADPRQMDIEDELSQKREERRRADING